MHIALARRSTTSPFAGSTTRYLPFGSYRTTPTQAVTDRDFTGQKENRELGLLYYNARYYLSGISRFASSDTIVLEWENLRASSYLCGPCCCIDNRLSGANLIDASCFVLGKAIAIES